MHKRRRELVAAALCSAFVWPLTGHAQPAEKMRHVGMLLPWGDNPQAQIRIAAFLEGLRQRNWTEGRNVRISSCWSNAHPDKARKCAADLVKLAPDVILAPGTSSLDPLLQSTRSIPIVFTIAPDPVGNGFVNSLARPGGNATGFMSREPSVSAKWVQLLKEIAPNVTRVVVLRDPTIRGGISQWSAIEAVAPLLKVEVIPANVRDANEIRRALADFSKIPNSGLIVTGGPYATTHRELIIELASQYKLPSVYYNQSFVAVGGLLSYGANDVDQFRRAADYVDRILAGEKPADLPVQAPKKYELGINRKTAKLLGLIVPPSLIAGADKVVD